MNSADSIESLSRYSTVSLDRDLNFRDAFQSSRLQASHSAPQAAPVQSLLELTAQTIACHLPFGVVERFHEPVPEPLQLRIAFWSFPQDEEDVRLYACLANGGSAIFARAVDIVEAGHVSDVLQVGFQLSGNVYCFKSVKFYQVSITFDRRKITSCSCSCGNGTLWCEHVIAVALVRIRRPEDITTRVPISESLQRLDREKLVKFAQYLINDLHYNRNQVVPNAQLILDQLLSNNNQASINKTPAAPDPTAGAAELERPAWCLDDLNVSTYIKKLIVKLCNVHQTVCIDINNLHNNPPQTVIDYDQVLKPMYNQLPEGLFNLLHLVTKLMRKRDSNTLSLLEILTQRILNHDRILTWWFETKVSLLSGSTFHVRPRSAAKEKSKGLSLLVAQYSTSNFCDELVQLWRLAALNPNSTQAERKLLRDRFFEWHLRILEKYKGIIDASTNHSGIRNMFFFSGFKLAMEGSLVEWNDWDSKNEIIVGDCNLKTYDQVKLGKHSRKKKNRSKKAKELAPNNTDEASQQNNIHKNGCDVEFCEAGTSSTTQPNSSNQHQHHQSICDTPDASSEPIALRNQSDAVVELIQNDLIERGEDAQVEQGHIDVAGHQNEIDVIEHVGGLQVPDFINDFRPPMLPEDALQVYYMPEPQHIRPMTPPYRRENLEDLIRINPKRLADPLETCYAKTEGLYAHGHLEEAEKLAVRVAQAMLTDPTFPAYKPNHLVLRRRKKKNNSDNQISILTSEGLSQITFICSILIQRPYYHHIVFKLALFGLEIKRSPAATKQLEVKLIKQKQDLIQLLKSMVLTKKELFLIRDKAQKMCDGEFETYDALTALLLGQYLFEILVSTSDAELGFHGAIAALKIRTNVPEIAHPLLCEGTRRQRGELALTLLINYKEDKEKLDHILKNFLYNDVILSAPPSAQQPQSLPQTKAASYYMFELAQKLFEKAGGLTSQIFRMPQLDMQNNTRGVHRNLHLCSLQIALYSLDLDNRRSPNWKVRTYNGRASFIQEQVLDIGLPAINLLCDRWESSLSARETSAIADKAGCSQDPDMRYYAAKLAIACLKYGSQLDNLMIKRIHEQGLEWIPQRDNAQVVPFDFRMATKEAAYTN